MGKLNNRTDFLKYTIDYLESRIRFLDNKASILIAAQGVILATVAYIAKEVFLTSCQLDNLANPDYKALVYAFLTITSVISISTMILLLQTIRPTGWHLGLEVPLKHLERKHYVMWPWDKFREIGENYAEEYKKKTRALNPLRIKRNYEETHFVCLQLISRKYAFYRWAVRSMELSVLWSAIGIGTVSLVSVKRLSVLWACGVWIGIWAFIADLCIILWLKEREKGRANDG